MINKIIPNNRTIKIDMIPSFIILFPPIIYYKYITINFIKKKKFEKFTFKFQMIFFDYSQTPKIIPAMASINPKIQNVFTISGSFQPSFSK